MESLQAAGAASGGAGASARWQQFDSAQAKRQLSERKQGVARWVAIEGNPVAPQVRADFVPKAAAGYLGGPGAGGEEDKSADSLSERQSRRPLVVRRAEQSSAEEAREEGEAGPAARLGKLRGAHAELVQLLNEFNYRLQLKPKKKMLPVELAPRPPRKAACGVCEQSFPRSELRTQQLRISIRELRRIFAERRAASASAGVSAGASGRARAGASSPAAALASRRGRAEPEQPVGQPAAALVDDPDGEPREHEHDVCEPEQPPRRASALLGAASSQSSQNANSQSASSPRRPRPPASGASGKAPKARPGGASVASNNNSNSARRSNNDNDNEEGDEAAEAQLEGRTCSKKYKMSALYDRVWVCSLCSQFFPVHEADEKRTELLEASLQTEARMTGTIFKGAQWAAHVKHNADLIAAVEAAAVKAAGATPSKGVLAKLPRVAIAMQHSLTCERRQELELEGDLARLDHESAQHLARGGAPVLPASRAGAPASPAARGGAPASPAAPASPSSPRGGSPRSLAASPRDYDYACELRLLGELVGLLERRLDGERHVPGLALKMRHFLDDEERRVHSARQHGWVPLGVVHDSGAAAEGAYSSPPASPAHRHPRALEAQRVLAAAAFNVSQRSEWGVESVTSQRVTGRGRGRHEGVLVVRCGQG
jgi:hypothetical protein